VIKLYTLILPCTLYLSLLATWDQVVADHDVAGFHKQLCKFIDAHATDDDHHEVMEYIRNVRKPCLMNVQLHFCRLDELNQQVDC
jgi:hypothetical protein